MKLDWDNVLDDLHRMERTTYFIPGDALTLDTLCGSMWGLNIRYTALKDALSQHRSNMIKYAIDRVQALKEYPPLQTKKRTLPRCRVGYGTFGWKYDHKLIEYVIDQGMLIDTAEGYGYGRVETELGKVINGNPGVEIMSKVRRDHMSPTAIVNSVNRSVGKLTVNPHFQTHFPHINYPDAIKDIAGMRQAGKIKSIGLSNCSIDMIEMSQNLLSDSTGDSISFVQMPYNVMNKRVENIFVPYCQAQGIYIVTYSPLGQVANVVDTPVVRKVAKKYSATSTQVALSYLLSTNGVIPIPVTNNMDHLKQNIEANELTLDEEDIDIIRNN